MCRSNIDNAPPALLLHVRQCSRRAVKDRREVQCNDGVPAIDGEIFNKGGVLYAGIVHQDVDTPQRLYRLFDETAGVVATGEVGVQVDGTYAEFGFYCSPSAFDFIGIAETVDHYICPVTGQLTGNRQADPTGRACHYRFLAFEHIVPSYLAKVTKISGWHECSALASQGHGEQHQDAGRSQTRPETQRIPRLHAACQP